MIEKIAKSACDAYIKTMCANIDQKNKVLSKIAELLSENKDKIFRANSIDLENAKKLLDENKINLAHIIG